MAHYRYSPSGAYRWFCCPGCLRAQDGIPDSGNKYAAEGTLAHEVGAALLMAKPKTPACTEEMFAHCEAYRDTVQDFFAPAKTRLWVEREILSEVIPDFGGTIDAIVWNEIEKELILFDLKYGKGVQVFAESNLQLLCYAALAMELPEFAEAKTIKMYIYQPRADVNNPLRGDHTTPQAIAVWREKTLLPAIAAAGKSNAPLCAGDWCRWCRAFGSCSQARDTVQDAAMVKLKGSPIAPPEPESLNPEQMRRVLDFAETLQAWVKAVEAEGIARLARGEKIEGRKLVQKSTHRKWIDANEAAKALEKYGHAIWTAPELISPAQAEKLAKGKEAKTEVNALAYHPEGDLTIAEESDKRPAVIPAAVAMAALEAEDSYLR